MGSSTLAAPCSRYNSLSVVRPSEMNTRRSCSWAAFPLLNSGHIFPLRPFSSLRQGPFAMQTRFYVQSRRVPHTVQLPSPAGCFYSCRQMLSLSIQANADMSLHGSMPMVFLCTHLEAQHQHFAQRVAEPSCTIIFAHAGIFLLSELIAMAWVLPCACDVLVKAWVLQPCRFLFHDDSVA